jgi:hypothetical protein
LTSVGPGPTHDGGSPRSSYISMTSLDLTMLIYPGMSRQHTGVGRGYWIISDSLSSNCMPRTDYDHTSMHVRGTHRCRPWVDRGWRVTSASLYYNGIPRTVLHNPQSDRSLRPRLPVCTIMTDRNLSHLMSNRPIPTPLPGCKITVRQRCLSPRLPVCKNQVREKCLPFPACHQHLTAEVDRL